MDWNDYGIDDVAIHEVVHGTPPDWFTPYGWRVNGTEQGSEWDPVTRAVLEAARGENPDRVPSMAWFKTRKGRGYGKYDNKSHGSPHAMNSPEFWAVRHEFMDALRRQYEGVDEAAPTDAGGARRAGAAQLRGRDGRAARPDRRGRRDHATGSPSSPPRCPSTPTGFTLGGHGAEIFSDTRFTDVTAYPASMWKQPGEKAPNRAALATWGAWVNAYREGGVRPAAVHRLLRGPGRVDEHRRLQQGLRGHARLGLVQPRHEPARHAAAAADHRVHERGHHAWASRPSTWPTIRSRPSTASGRACSTYGSFCYLKYGPMRLFSQLAQDADLKVGKVLWVAGHSGPETAEDSRTHFGIFSTGVTQLFPEGHVIDLHPWEYNEVPVVLAAALATEVPIVALHLTRPSVEIPDRAALGMASHFEAARGAYVLRRATPGEPCAGTVYVQGTMSTANLVKMLPELERRGSTCGSWPRISPQLFRMQDAAYRDELCSEADRWDGMAITNRAFKLMRDWVDGPIAAEYSLSSDWDDRWRTGGTVDEVIDEAHLGPEHILAAIERYVGDRQPRLRRLRALVESVAHGHPEVDG